MAEAEVRGRFFSPLGLLQAPLLKEDKGDHGQEGVSVQLGPGAALKVVEPELFLELLVGLLAGPARLYGRRKGVEIRVRRQVEQVVLALACGACSPTAHTSSPGRCFAPMSWMRCGGPSARRTRNAAKRVASRPLVPRRQLSVCQSASASTASTGRLSWLGRWCWRGRPCPATGKIISRSTG